jgi:hypothetical protein
MAAELRINDNGTWRKAKEVHVNDNGTWRKCKEVHYNDNGTWRKVFGGIGDNNCEMVAGFRNGVQYGYVSTPPAIGSWQGTVNTKTVNACTSQSDLATMTIYIAGFLLEQTHFTSMTINGPGFSNVTYLSANASFNTDVTQGIWNWSGQSTMFTNGGTYSITFT